MSSKNVEDFHLDSHFTAMLQSELNHCETLESKTQSSIENKTLRLEQMKSISAVQS